MMTRNADGGKERKVKCVNDQAGAGQLYQLVRT